MTRQKKGISERAVERLEEKGYLMTIRAEMKAEVMKVLVEMEEEGAIPQHLRIKRYSPASSDDTEALALIAEFLRYHGLNHSVTCLLNEVHGEIPNRHGSGGKQSELAAAIQKKADEDRDGLD
jgi:hypothetical protein